MKHLLIDTNCWLDFIRNNETESILDKIEYWLNSGFATLLVPNRLLQEWEKQSVIQLKDLKTEHDKINTKSSRYTILTLNAEYGRILGKVERITDLLIKGVRYSSSEKVKADVTDRFEKEIAPFHKKLNSTADAIIYLSTLDYLKSQRGDSFYFFTRNVKDFSESDSQRNEIHPDLVNKEIQVNYYTDPQSFVHHFGKDLPTPLTKPGDENQDFIKQFVLVDRKAKENLTDILYGTLLKHYEELPFIPTHILTRLFPFKKMGVKHSYTYFNGFTLSINNDELDLYFRSITISENNDLVFSNPALIGDSPHEKQKVFEILRKLNQNLVYYLNLVPVNNSQSIQLKSFDDCQCIRCAYGRLHLLSSYRDLVDSNSELLNEILKMAQMHFVFGNYSKALELYFKIYQRAKLQKLPILVFISFQNCKKLKSYIETLHIVKSLEILSICEMLDKISIQDELISSSQESGYVQENIRWISERGYFNTVKFEIFEILAKIRAHYNSQLAGGYSSNSHLMLLMSHFAELDLYVEQNSILIAYEEMQDIFDGVVEGLFMSHKFNKDQDQRMISFDDFWLFKIVFYSRPKRLLQLCQQLSINNLIYKSENQGGERFADSVIQFLLDYEQFITLIPEKLEDKGYSFWRKYQTIFSNILVLLNLVDLGEEIKKKITTTVVENLIGLQLIRKTDMIYLGRFIYKNGKYLSQESVNLFLQKVIENEDLHELTIFEALSAVVCNGEKALISNPATYHALVETFLKECPKCKKIHAHDILVNIYLMLNKDLKEDLREKLTRNLIQEFNPDIFYSFCIHGVLTHEGFFDKFVESCTRPVSFGKVRHPFVRGETQLPRLGEILNLAFKYGMNIMAGDLQQFKGLSDYYDWLLDIEGFDYSKFTPDWILQYPTKYYLEKIFASEKIKNILKKYLIKNDNPTLRQYFIEYS